MKIATMNDIRKMVTEVFEKEGLLSIYFCDDDNGCSAEILSVIEALNIDGKDFGLYISGIFVALNHFNTILYNTKDDCYVLENPGFKIQLAAF